MYQNKCKRPECSQTLHFRGLGWGLERRVEHTWGMSVCILKYNYFRRYQSITNDIWMSNLPGGGQKRSPAINKLCVVFKLKAQIQRLSTSQEKNPNFFSMQAASLLHKNLLLETDGSLQDLQILCLEWQTRPYCPSKSTVTL